MAPPASAFKKAPKKEELPLTAVLILQSFDQRFAPFMSDYPLGLLKICNVPVINYTLTCLLRADIQNVMLVVSGDNAKHVELIEKTWSLVFEDLKLIKCDGATNVGDCLREIHNRELITSDFLFIPNPATITSSTLTSQIAQFRKRRQENADNVMTLIYSESEDREKSVVGINSDNKLVLYPPINKPGRLKVDKPDFLSSVTIRRDIAFSGIALCSRLIATQFSDNFDFQTLNDVIRELLSKDDILGLSIHVDVLNPTEAAFNATDYDSLLTLNNLVLERWFYPLTPAMADFSKFFKIAPRNLYIEESDPFSARLSTSNFLNNNCVNVSLGKNAQVSELSNISNASVGISVIIGDNTRINNSIIGDNCKISANCVIENTFLFDNVTITDGTHVVSETIIGKDVVLRKELKYPPQSAICHKSVDKEEFDKITSKKHDSVHIWTMRNGLVFWNQNAKVKTSNESDTTDDDLDDGYGDDSETENGDPTKQFYEEVLESMKGILGSSNPQMNNLILEINSSKLACNVVVDDVARNVFAAFLVLPGNDQLKAMFELVKKWRLLFLNYYKSSEESLAAKTPSQRKMELELKRKCQIQMLFAIEDRYEKNSEEFGPKVAKLVHFLYNEADILDEEAILDWAKGIAEESNLKKIMKPIIDWLMQDSEDEDEEEDEE